MTIEVHALLSLQRARQVTRTDGWPKCELVCAVLSLLPSLQGNHELESIDGAPDSFLAYESRWRMPYERSGSKSALYYSYETGPAHILMLGSYAAYGHGSKQVSGWPCCSDAHGVVVLQGSLHTLAHQMIAALVRHP